jgi:hypothetical protein
LLILQQLLPQAEFVVIDMSLENIETAHAWVNGRCRFVHGVFDAERMTGLDLVVIPLAFVGDRAALYRSPPAPAMLIHDWLWRRHGVGAVVSVFLLKRLNLVRP